MSEYYQPTHRSFLQLSGPDAVRFLNGQVTNEISRDLSKVVVPACLCTLKGRVEALIWVTAGEQENSLIIETETEQAESVFNRMDRYLIADDCELTMLDEPLAVVHSIADDAVGKVCQRLGANGMDHFGSQPATSELMSEEQADYLKVKHGIPEFGYEITGEEFPSELGLDKWTVDFHKGCYLGQEIVSRIESVGKTKKRLVLVSSDQTFEKGEVFEDDKTGKVMARVTRDSVKDVDAEAGYLTLLMARGDWRPDFGEMLEIEYPKKL